MSTATLLVELKAALEGEKKKMECKGLLSARSQMLGICIQSLVSEQYSSGMSTAEQLENCKDHD